MPVFGVPTWRMDLLVSRLRAPRGSGSLTAARAFGRRAGRCQAGVRRPSASTSSRRGRGRQALGPRNELGPGRRGQRSHRPRRSLGEPRGARPRPSPGTARAPSAAGRRPAGRGGQHRAQPATARRAGDVRPGRRARLARGGRLDRRGASSASVGRQRGAPGATGRRRAAGAVAAAGRRATTTCTRPGPTRQPTAGRGPGRSTAGAARGGRPSARRSRPADRGAALDAGRPDVGEHLVDGSATQDAPAATAARGGPAAPSSRRTTDVGDRCAGERERRRAGSRPRRGSRGGAGTGGDEQQLGQRAHGHPDQLVVGHVGRVDRRGAEPTRRPARTGHDRGCCARPRPGAERCRTTSASRANGAPSSCDTIGEAAQQLELLGAGHGPAARHGRRRRRPRRDPGRPGRRTPAAEVRDPGPGRPARRTAGGQRRASLATQPPGGAADPAAICSSGSGRAAASRVIATSASSAASTICGRRGRSGLAHGASSAGGDRPQVVDVADHVDAGALDPLDPLLGDLLGPAGSLGGSGTGHVRPLREGLVHDELADQPAYSSDGRPACLRRRLSLRTQGGLGARRARRWRGRSLGGPGRVDAERPAEALPQHVARRPPGCGTVTTCTRSGGRPLPQRASTSGRSNAPEPRRLRAPRGLDPVEEAAEAHLRRCLMLSCHAAGTWRARSRAE